MRIMMHPLKREFWWYHCPTTLAARIHGMLSSDRLPVIWVRPLTGTEVKRVQAVLAEQN